MQLVKTINSKQTLWQLTLVEARRQLAPLLFLADESWVMIEKYLPDSRIWAVRDERVFVACLVVEQLTEHRREIKAIAVAPEFQRQGLGRLLINFATELATGERQQELLVGTGDGSIVNLSFYLHNGFRFAAIRPNFFKQYPEPIYENGIQLRDMIVLNKILTVSPVS